MTAGYILGPDYCEIKTPDGFSFAFKRDHPIRQPDGKYQEGAEWTDQFKRRMISIITENGFPIHEDNPHWLPTNKELDEIERMPDMLPDEESQDDSITDFPTHWDGPELS